MGSVGRVDLEMTRLEAGRVIPTRGRTVQTRLAEPVVALSGIGDLARTRRTGAAARSAFIACRLARALDLPDDVVRDAFYTALLQHIGCVGYAHEAAAIFGGRDVEMNSAGSQTDFADPVDLFRTFVPELGAGLSVLSRMRILTAALTKAPRLGGVIHRASCEVGASTAERIGLSPGVAAALRQVEEWYDGRGGYLGTSGDAVPVASRVVLTAFMAAVFDELAGADAAIQVVAKRGGRQLDPDIATAFTRVGRDILAELASSEVDVAVLDEEPWPHAQIDAQGLDEVALAFGDVVDLKTVRSLGSARRGYHLAQGTATQLGLDFHIVADAGRAAALRDVGKAAISNAILDKSGELTRAELDELQLHAYHSERTLARAPALAQTAALAGLHHEHEDGSGYHRGLPGKAIPVGGKVLCAVEAFLAATQRGMSNEVALSRVEGLARRGTLNGDVVQSLAAVVSGGRRPWARSRPAGLSERQVEVVRLLSEGLSNKQIAGRLVVSPRTAEHHVQDIYAKIGVSSRAAVALFAMEHQLLEARDW